MTSQPTKEKKAKIHPSMLRWSRFNVKRSSKAAWESVEHNVSVSVPSGSTSQFAIGEIARDARIAIDSLCAQLNEPRFFRGAVFFGCAGNQFEKIARNYRHMQWWISDKGLNMAILPPDVPELSPFDQLAGSLTAARWENGRLSKEALWGIAKALDDEAFTLKKELQPAQWRPIARHNSKCSRTPIKTFLMAAHNPAFVRLIRRRLYVARERYVRAERAVNEASG